LSHCPEQQSDAVVHGVSSARQFAFGPHVPPLHSALQQVSAVEQGKPSI
jgi:hypothetical protein